MKYNTKKDNGKGFTLVELLAVIVILAVILVIAVPKVISVIEDAKKATLESSAKIIAGQAEKQNAQNATLGNTEEITCDSIVNINKRDYASCEIEFDEEGTAYVTIIGSGKFDGLQVIKGTKTDATATEIGSSGGSDEEDITMKTSLKFGREYIYKTEISGVEYKSSIIVYKDGSGIMCNNDGCSRSHARAITIDGNEITCVELGMTGTVSEDGTEFVGYQEDMLIGTFKLSESPIYFGMPYSINTMVDEVTPLSLTIVFYPDGQVKAYADGENSGSIVSVPVTYDANNIIDSNGIKIGKVSSDGKKIELSNDRELFMQLDLVEEPIYFGVPYSGTTVLGGNTENISVILSQAGVAEVYVDGDFYGYSSITYLDGYVELIAFETMILTVSPDKRTITGDDTFLSLNQLQVIPEGATYTTGLVYNESTNKWDDTNAVTYQEGDYFPIEPKPGDIYRYGDYEYRYNAVILLGEWYGDLENKPLVADSGWGVRVRDYTKSSYEPMLSTILEEPVTNAGMTYAGCINLVEAPSLPNTLISLTDTFRECTSLTKAPAIPSSVVYMFYTFYGCTSLKNVAAIPNSVEDMTRTFENCTSLVNAPDMSNATSVTDMYATFSGCTALENVSTLPKNVVDMSGAFEDCTSLKNVAAIPNSVEDMARTFENCTSLVNAPDMSNATSVTDMYATFSGCTALENVSTLPKNVVDMSYTFAQCTKLTSAPTLPSSVENMAYAFEDCTSLVNAPDMSNLTKLTSMNSAFKNCTSLVNAPDMSKLTKLTSMESAFKNCTSLTSAPVIPSSVTFMKDTFSGCTKLTSAPTLPSSVMLMENAFYGCTSLTGTIQINTSTTIYENMLFNTQITEVTGSTPYKSEILATKTGN